MKKYRRTLYASFITSLSTAAVGNLSPLLFLTFRSMYGISYTLLGTLIVMNFGTQLLLDLLFSFFSKKLNVKLSTRLTPVLMTAGFVLYALTPVIFPDHIYFGLALSTIVFSGGSGLSEVLSSPVVAALPSKNPDRLLSRLHSCYAWGVVALVIVATLFIRIFGAENWPYLAALMAVPPFIASVLFAGAPIPETEPDDDKDGTGIFRNKILWLCVFCIFLGGASECTMSQWCSTYLEQALGIEKVWGDIFGFALFGFALGLGRTLYGYFGKKIIRFLIAGSFAAFLCYAGAVLFTVPVLGLACCALTGFCVSMLWPGSLIATDERVEGGGVAMYAIMAAGGDLGASVVPQLVGIVADAVIAGTAMTGLAEKLSLSSEQMAMKTGLGFAALFPLCAFFCFIALSKHEIIREKK